MSDVNKPADVELEAAIAGVKTIEVAFVQLAERRVALTAKLKTVADELIEQQRVSGLGFSAAIRTIAHEKVQGLAEQERALRDELNQFRALEENWKQRLAAARLRVEEAELLRAAAEVVAQTTGRSQ